MVVEQVDELFELVVVLQRVLLIKEKFYKSNNLLFSVILLVAGGLVVAATAGFVGGGACRVAGGARIPEVPVPALAGLPNGLNIEMNINTTK